MPYTPRENEHHKKENPDVTSCNPMSIDISIVKSKLVSQAKRKMQFVSVNKNRGKTLYETPISDLESHLLTILYVWTEVEMARAPMHN